MTREELYALVWANPMIHLAKSYGLSDVGLRKICVKHGIPTPPLGYWSKVAAGKKVKQPSLQPAAKNLPVEIRLRTIEIAGVPDEVASAQAAADQYEAAHKVIVPDARPEILNPVTVKVEKLLRKARPDDEGFLNCISPGLPNIAIGPSSVDRAILILDTLIKASLDRGWHLKVVNDDFCIVVKDERFTVSFYETKQKISHVPTKDDLKRQRDHDESRKRFPTLYSDVKVYRSWDYQPSGRMALKILDPTHCTWRGEEVVGRWRDHDTKKLESYLGEVMVALATEQVRVKMRRAEEAERVRRQAEVEARYYRLAARRERAQNRREFLELKAGALAKLKQLQSLSDFWQEELARSPEPLVGRMGQDLLGFVKELQRELSPEVLAGEISRLGLVIVEDLQACQAD